MARLRVELKGLHRVRKVLSDGSVAEYHYAWRGGPRIWDKATPFRVNSIEYVEAFRAATTAQVDTGGTFQSIIQEFVNSSDFQALGTRTQRDHLKNIAKDGGIEATFGKAPIGAFEDKRIRPKILKWRDTFSTGTGDNIMATMQRIVSFAYQRGLLGEHHLLRLKKRTKTNRAGIVWTQEEITTFCSGAPRYVGRILIAAVETGLRPGDLCRLQRSDFEFNKGAHGRIVLRTNKSGGKTYASIPVTERMAAMVRELPEHQESIIVGSKGTPFKNSESMGQAISEWRDKLEMRSELRLYDARGTAATRLVRAGCSLIELAGHMGWKPQHAAQMLERYAALDPDMTDSILEKVERDEKRRSGA